MSVSVNTSISGTGAGEGGNSGYLGYGTIAMRNALTGLVAGDIYYTSDFGTADICWRWDGAKWRPLNGVAVLGSGFAASFAPPGNSTAFAIATLDVPAGAWTDGLALRVDYAYSKSGAADAYEQSLRMGATGVYADTALFAISHAATNDYAGTQLLLTRTSATTIKRSGAGAVGSMDSLVSASTSAGPVATVANLDSASNKLTLWGKWTTGTAETAVIDYSISVIG